MDTLCKIKDEIEVDGMVLPGKAVSKRNVMEVKDNLIITERDVLVASYPRSGNTWLGEAAYLIFTEGNFESTKTVQYERIMYVEHACLAPDMSVSETECFLTKLKTRQEQLVPTVIKTHLPAKYMRNKIENKNAKLIYLMRNPKDVLCSLYNFYHQNTLIDFKGNWEDFLALWREKRLIYGDWLEHNTGYWEMRHLPNVLILTYENAKSDMIGTLGKIAKFLGKSLKNETLEQICEHLKFQNMQQNKAVNCEEVSHIIRGDFIRKGMVGSWKDVFTVAQSEEIDYAYANMIKQNKLPILL